jgi:hypothetical protein
MAVTQISRIQHRRGLEQDLPQLSSAELGWSVDTRQLYIGNGTLAEGAPIIGVTRILTEHDIYDITSNTSFFTNYTFVGNAAGYTAQTGPSALAPVVRSYQQKFDDVVNIRDFGAVGDNTTDDTAAINRAIQQIYRSTVSPTEPRARRAIFFPGGSYLISSPILVPPYAKLVGDGTNSVVIRQSQGNQSVANVCDSSFQTGTSIGSGSTVFPQDIEITGIQFLNSNASPSRALFQLDSASNVRIQSCTFRGNAGAGFYNNCVSIRTSTSTVNKVTFDSCQFINAGNGIGIMGTGVTSVRVMNSSFDRMSNSAAHLGNSTGFVSIGNFISSSLSSTGFISNGNNFNYGFGNYYENSNLVNSGLYLGNCVINPTQQFTITTTPSVFVTAANSAGVVEYQLKSGSNIRIGTLTLASQGSTLTYLDSYIETPTGVDANISANNDSILVSVSSGTATYTYTFKQFI